MTRDARDEPGRVLVGRTQELGALWTHLRAANDGRPRVVLVRGPPGIGKTSLLLDFLASAAPEAATLWAVADEDERDLPFGVVHQLVRDADRSLARDLAAAVADGGPVPDAHAVGVSMLEVFGRLQDSGPLVVAVDDVVHADEPSLTALTFALRRLRFDRVVTVLTARPEDDGQLAGGLLRLIGERSRGHTLELEGLGPDELRELSRASGLGDMSLRVARRLHEHTGGNPLHARSLLEFAGPAAFRDDDPPPVPPSVAATVLERLARCDAATARLVRAASVLGRQSDLAVVVQVADVDDPAAVVERAITTGLVNLDGIDQRSVAFGHPLVRAAVYSSLSLTERRELHCRAAGVLVGDVALHHRVRGADPVDEELADALRERSAEQVASRSWSAAARNLRRASWLHPDPAVRSECLLRSAALYVEAADYASAAGLIDHIRGLDPSPWRDYILGRLALSVGDLEEGDRLLERALHGCDPSTDAAVGAAAAFVLAANRLTEARSADAIDFARAALALATPDSPAQASWAAVMIGMSIAGRPAEALELVRDLDPAAGDFQGLGVLLGSGIAHLYLDDLEAARRHLSAVLEPLVHRAPGLWTGPALFFLAEAEWRAGAWDDAFAHGHLGASIAADADDHLAAGNHASLLASLHGSRGEWEAADAAARLAVAKAQMSGAPSAMTYASLGAGRVAHARGDAPGVIAALEPLVELRSMDGVGEHVVAPWTEMFADALVKLGDLDGAETWVHLLEEQATQRDARSVEIAALRCRASVLTAAGDHRQAQQRLDRALAIAHEVPMPFVRARVEADLGSVLRRLGERRSARVHLVAAADTFERLGADPFNEACERELRACGERRMRRGVAHLALTPQEFAVAGLVGRGLSNREAAAELLVSVKTIEYHLTNLYAKLGVRSRTQLVARLAAGESALRVTAGDD